VTAQTHKLLLVSDDAELRRQLGAIFAQYEVLTAANRTQALAELRRHEPPVVLHDLGSPVAAEEMEERLATLSEIVALAPHTKVIVVTSNDDRLSRVRAVALGAHDFYHKPLELEVLRLIVNRAFRVHELEDENRRLTRDASASPLEGVIATSDSMLRVCRIVEKVAPTRATVLLLGESGTGKELLARAVHRLSGRAQERFVAINCAAIPETLLESELFGYEKGAFSGAHRQTIGKIEYAQGGTLFLDEVGDMPASLQAKLLRFLQERVIERIGGRELIPIDVRVVCATNRDLAAAFVDSGFRQDLYHRISEVTVKIPALRERNGDSLVIAQSLLHDRVQRHGRSLRGFAADAISAIQTYEWPGNIRELENKVNAAVIMAEGTQVTAADLGLAARIAESDVLNLKQARLRAEEEALRRALAISRGNLSRAAELLGVTRPTLYDLLEKTGLRHAEH
jgi:two-component system NtrC family response regulator